MYIYKITNLINNKSYIGQTNNFQGRMWCHNNRNTLLIDKAIQKYGAQNFKYEILFSNVDVKDIDQKEQECILEYNTLAPHGYNVKLDVKNVRGEENPNSILSIEEAQWILDNRNIKWRDLYEICPFKDKISLTQFVNIYNGYEWRHLTTTTIKADNSNIHKGEQCTMSKYTNAEVYQIRENYAKGIYYKTAWELSGKKVTLESFYNIYIGHGYEDVHMDVYTEENKKKHKPDHSGENNGRAKLTKKDVLLIRELHDKGISNSEIYLQFPQVSKNAIRDVINRNTWKNI